jgi:hypothetical protein
MHNGGLVVYTCVSECVCVCVYIYIYIYIHTHAFDHPLHVSKMWRGQRRRSRNLHSLGEEKCVVAQCIMVALYVYTCV